MPHNYAPLIGREYEPPHGCLRLCEQVYREVYGIDTRNLDAGIDANDGRALYGLIQRMTTEVGEEREGDLVLIRSTPWHVGIVIGDGEFIHSYHGGAAVIENYCNSLWRNRVVSFHRYSA